MTRIAIILLASLYPLIIFNGCKKEQKQSIETTKTFSESENLTSESENSLKSLTGYRYIKPFSEQLLFMSKENGKGIYSYDLINKSINEINESALGFDYHIEKGTVLFKVKNKDYSTQVVSYDIVSKSTTNIPISSEIILSSIHDMKQLFLNKKDLSITIKNKATKKEIVIKGEQKFYAPLQSPDKKYLLVHEGVNMKLYDLKGNLLKNIGQGLATSWSSKSSIILFFKDISHDGHEISNSEIYAYDLTKDRIVQLTNTKNIIEAYPYFSNDQQIIFNDLKTEETKTMSYE